MTAGCPSHSVTLSDQWGPFMLDIFHSFSGSPQTLQAVGVLGFLIFICAVGIKHIAMSWRHNTPQSRQPRSLTLRCKTRPRLADTLVHILAQPI